jgi:hypothetical protein
MAEVYDKPPTTSIKAALVTKPFSNPSPCLLFKNNYKGFKLIKALLVYTIYDCD